MNPIHFARSGIHQPLVMQPGREPPEKFQAAARKAFGFSKIRLPERIKPRCRLLFDQRRRGIDKASPSQHHQWAAGNGFSHESKFAFFAHSPVLSEDRHERRESTRPTTVSQNATPGLLREVISTPILHV
jgi:hypothetical protein